jgi:hypothetical protein
MPSSFETSSFDYGYCCCVKNVVVVVVDLHLVILPIQNRKKNFEDFDVVVDLMLVVKKLMMRNLEIHYFLIIIAVADDVAVDLLDLLQIVDLIILKCLCCFENRLKYFLRLVVVLVAFVDVVRHLLLL